MNRDKWKPNDSRICSAHFIQGAPSDDPVHPDYAPSRFLYRKAPTSQNVQRYNRQQARSTKRGAAEPKDVSSDQAPTDPENIEAVVCCESSTRCDVSVATTLSSKDIEHLKAENASLKSTLAETQHQLHETSKLLKEYKATNLNLIAGINKDSATQAALHSDIRVKFYTGIVSLHLFNALLTFILSVWQPDVTCLLPQEQLVLVLMKLRLGLLNEDLACRFKVSVTTVGAVFHAWLDILSHNLGKLIVWPSRRAVSRNLPTAFGDPIFKNVIGAYYCVTKWSRYFHLGGMGGRVSDKELTLKSGLLNLVNEGDVYLVDRGFRCQEMFAAKGARLLIPAFTKGKNQLSGAEKRDDGEIYTIDKALIVCAALTNLQPPLLKK
ncbi:uncharacterized protein LOC120841760 [Ixodes scapularis]|uniref:uncharacterized protein LOC120841760 n=1 Tax=Ixodes scapularis TaxID=6945 RepID=UPI001A9E012F|nr:uncharacterized protein LOC120841760 [Ixodes scapularis]